jgi:hypothetical protein
MIFSGKPMPYPYTTFETGSSWTHAPGVKGDKIYVSFCTYNYVRTKFGAIMEVAGIYPQGSLVPPEKWRCVTPICPPRVSGQDIVLFRKPSGRRN